MLAASKMVLDFAPEEWTSGTRLVALAVADRVNVNTHEVYPSIADICRRTGLSRRMVQKHLRILEEADVIKKVGFRQVKGGGLGTNVWRWVWLKRLPGGVTDDTWGVSYMTGGGVS